MLNTIPKDIKLFLNMQSQDRVFHKGGVETVTGLNDKGEFDILLQHANFISLVRNYIIIDKGLKTEKKFAIAKGILRTTKNRVDIFLD